MSSDDDSEASLEGEDEDTRNAVPMYEHKYLRRVACVERGTF